MKIILKKITCLAIVFIFIQCIDIFSKTNKHCFENIFQKTLPGIYSNKKLSAEDKALSDAYVLVEILYKKIIEMAALYWCKDLIVDADVLYDQILFDMSKDLLKLIKLLAYYVPLVCKNKKTSKIIKIKKLTGASCVMALSIMMLKNFYEQKFVAEKTKM